MESTSPHFRSFIVSGNRFDVPCHYELLQAIGYGAYGVVCAARDTRTNAKVAIKKISSGTFLDLSHFNGVSIDGNVISV